MAAMWADPEMITRARDTSTLLLDGRNAWVQASNRSARRAEQAKARKKAKQKAKAAKRKAVRP